MKNINLILAIILCVFSGILNAQQVIKIGDTLKMNIGNNYRGNLQWQTSNDQINWTDIAGATTGNLNQVITQRPTYLRSKTTEGACAPVYSNLATVDSFLEVTPAANYTDSVMVTEYQNASFANQAIGLQSQVLLPNNKGKVYYYGSFNAGVPDKVKEAKVYSLTGDTVLNVKYDTSDRIKAFFFTVRGIKQDYIYSFNYGPTDTVRLKVFKVWWNKDSLRLIHEIGFKSVLDSLKYAYDVSYKTDGGGSRAGMGFIERTSRLLNVLAAVAVTVDIGGPALALCVANPPVCGIVVVFALGLAINSSSPIAQAVINIRPPSLSPFKQSITSLLQTNVYSFKGTTATSDCSSGSIEIDISGTVFTGPFACVNNGSGPINKGFFALMSYSRPGGIDPITGQPYPRTTFCNVSGSMIPTHLDCGLTWVVRAFGVQGGSGCQFPIGVSVGFSNGFGCNPGASILIQDLDEFEDIY